MRSLRTFWPRACAAIAVAGTTLAAIVYAGGASAAAGRQTYLQLNMCGNACNHGGLAVVRNLESSIVVGRPFAVTLNEVCENQYDQLRADLGPTMAGSTRPGPGVATAPA